MHAHYGTTCTGILTFAYNNITKDGSEGTIGTNYLFIETASNALPLFTKETTRWNGIYSYQLLNVLIGNYNSTSIGDNFLRYCYSFNQPLTIPAGVSSMGTYFLHYCYAFNQPLDLSNVTTIGTYFLGYCYSFNQPLTIHAGVNSIGDYFLYSCYAFNQPLDLSNVTTIGYNFLNYCYAFNQPLTIPTGVNSIGTYFLGYCYSFNQPLTIHAGVSSIGDYFLNYCFAFNQPLTIHAGVNSIGTSFLYNAFGVSTIIWETTVYPTDNNSLSQTSNTKTSTTYGAGIVIYGSKSANLKTALPDRTSSPYRKLIDGEA
jgi:hypothetical protein